ncbi:MAG: ChaN family lipoprotein [Bacteroidota bacterium]
MKTWILLLLLVNGSFMLAQSDPQPYALFTESGKPGKYKKLLRAAREADVILFGESHNSAIAHWLQHVLLRDLAAEGPVTLGLEMFESDQQTILDAYLSGKVELKAINEVGSGLWPNFKTDYQPAVDFMKEKSYPVVATNVPRKYARMVFRQGFGSLDSLSAEEKALLPPLPVPYDAELPGYVRMLEMMAGGHGGETFPMAQAIKDATMAHFIVANHTAGQPFLHLNGSYHSDDFEGIGWYLKQYAPELRVMTISTVEQADVAKLAEENEGKAHFILTVPELMTTTY